MKRKKRSFNPVNSRNSRRAGTIEHPERLVTLRQQCTREIRTPRWLR